MTDRSKDYGTPVKEPAVERVSEDDLMRDFEGWGTETRALLSCIENPDRWNINVVFPFVETYVRDKVALVGDSVSFAQSPPFLSLSLSPSSPSLTYMHHTHVRDVDEYRFD